MRQLAEGHPTEKGGKALCESYNGRFLETNATGSLKHLTALRLRVSTRKIQKKQYVEKCLQSG